MGYEQDRFVDSFSPDLVCSICLCVLEDPVECKSCETNFCKECIDLWKSKNNLCPNKCQLSLQKSHRFLRSVLDNLKLKCSNTSFGCDQIITIERLKIHETQQCLYRRVQCCYPECREYFLHSEINGHEANCEHRIHICEQCGEAMKFLNHSEHNCISALATKLQTLLQTHKDNLKKLETIEKSCKNKIPLAKGEVHHGIYCNKCGMNPIVGVRHICLTCENYNLCWKCFGNDHNEHRFLQIADVGEHERITCDGCFTCPLKGIRYRCMTCQDFGNFYKDMCHNCMVNKGHILGHNYYTWCHFSVTVTPQVPERIGYRNDDILVRSWEIFNNSTQEINGLELTCISGDTCSKVYLAKKYNFYYSDVIIWPKTGRIITIKERIFQPIKGIHKCQLRMSTLERCSTFGPILMYELYILPS